MSGVYVPGATNNLTRKIDLGTFLKASDYSYSTLPGKPTTLTEAGITDAVPTTRTIAINGTTFDLSQNRSWTITTPAQTSQTLADAATTTWNIATGSIANWTLAGNRTLSVTNPTINSYGQIMIVQDGTGNRLVTWPASFKWEGGTAPTLSATAGAVDIVTCFYNGTSYFCNYGKDYK